MEEEEFKLIMFFCWQKKIKTLGQLAEFKALHKVETNKGLLNALCKAYNS